MKFNFRDIFARTIQCDVCTLDWNGIWRTADAILIALRSTISNSNIIKKKSKEKIQKINAGSDGDDGASAGLSLFRSRSR